MATLILVNPEAGNRKGASLVGALERTMRQGGLGFQVEIRTTTKGDLTDQLREVAPRIEKVVVIGGDGTLSQVLEAAWNLSLSVPFGIIPLGTGNDMARSLGIFDGKSWGIEKILSYLTAAQSRSVDIWAMNGRKCFNNYASIGLDAAVVRGFCRLRHHAVKSPLLRRKVSYFGLYLGVWLTQAAYRVPPGTVLAWTDQEGQRSQLAVGGARVLSFTNTPYYAAGCLMDPWASVGDGLLEITLFRNMAPYVELMATRFRPLAGIGLQRKWWRVKAKSVEIALPQPTPLQADGEDVTEIVGHEGLITIQKVGQVRIMVF